MEDNFSREWGWGGGVSGWLKCITFKLTSCWVLTGLDWYQSVAQRLGTFALGDCLGWGRENRKTKSKNKGRVFIPFLTHGVPFYCSDLKEKTLWSLCCPHPVCSSRCQPAIESKQGNTGERKNNTAGWAEFWCVSLIYLLGSTFQHPQQTHILSRFIFVFNGDWVEGV